MSLRHFNLAIVGAGPAGMAAAVEARRHNLSVAVLDDQPAAGGQILRGITTSGRPDYEKWGGPLAEAFESCGAEHIRGAAVWGREDSLLLYSRQGRTESIEADGVILATGSMERPCVVPGNTLPGVVTVGALQSLLKGSGCVPAGDFVLAGNGPLLLLCAVQLADAGAKASAIVQTTPGSRFRSSLWKAPGLLFDPALLVKGLGLMARIRRHGIAVYGEAGNIRIEGADRVSTIRFESKGRKAELLVEMVALHDGVVPNDNLAISFGAQARWNENLACYQLLMDSDTKVAALENVWAAGDMVAIYGGYQASITGRLAALDACLDLGFLSPAYYRSIREPLASKRRRLLVARHFVDAYYAPTLLPATAADDALLCRCEEVSVGAIRDRIAQGVDGTRAIKAATRCGMGPCQGRQCTVSLASMLGHDRPRSSFARPSLRFPARPITVAELAQSHQGISHTGSDS
ncbi:MAG: FAD-dependent oxidoreductase [Rhizobiaceae bacterium]|nr:FAD-dependent oxidoreductase [Rhizobiaceae bacterium]